MLDFPCMPFVVRKILQELPQKKFTEEEIRVGWYNPESDVMKVRRQVVNIIGQAMKEDGANPNGPYKDHGKKKRLLRYETILKVTQER